MRTNQFNHFISILSALLLCAGCANPKTKPPGPNESPATTSRSPALAEGDSRSAPEIGGDIALSRALSLALLNHPQLAAYSWEIRSREARALQAGLLPNPEFETEVENFGRSGGGSSFSDSEQTFALSQQILLGGKRAKARRVANREAELAEWDYESKRLDVLSRTTEAFIQTLAAQESLRLRQRQFELARQVHETITQEVEAGEISPVEKNRTQVIFSRSKIELEKARRTWVSAKTRLASTWGSNEPRFQRADGDLTAIQEIPAFASVASRVGENPDLARWPVEMRLRESRLSLEKARAIPDPKLLGGVRRLGESDESAFVAAVSIPLPVFDRNQGAIDAARNDLAKADQERRFEEVRVHAELAAAYQELQGARMEAVTLRDEVLPSAESAFNASEAAYREGKFNLIDVLDTQRTLFEVRVQFNQALAAYHLAKVRVEELTGAPLHNVRAGADSDSNSNSSNSQP